MMYFRAMFVATLMVSRIQRNKQSWLLFAAAKAYKEG